ncbi:MAG: flagellar motor stator protein MotA [Thermoguttaceae bacterium]
MIVVVGCVVVMVAVMVGFTGSGGKLPALIHPFELVTIGGAAMGALLIMSPKKVIVDLVRGLVQCVKGNVYNKRAYEEAFKLLYDLLRRSRRDGLISLEAHVTTPHESAVFQKYPLVSQNHHLTEFISSAISLAVEGIVGADQMPQLLEAEIQTMVEEHHAPLGVLTKTADAMPGFGIVAAVLGIVITMGSIDGPVEQIGEKVGAALVGTFLGILISYGFLGPLAVRMEILGNNESAFFRTVASIVQGFVGDLAPKVVIEKARRGVCSEFRPDRQRMDELLAEVEGS